MDGLNINQCITQTFDLTKDENESWKRHNFLFNIDYCSFYNLEQRKKHLECYKCLLMQIIGDYSGQLHTNHL